MLAMRTIVLEEDIRSGDSILEGRARERGGAFAAHYVSINEHACRPRQLARGTRDEMVLEAAVHGRAAALVTFNVRDSGTAPARVGIEAMVPREAIGRMRR
jgi:hypothetical protein